jgi:hypothetical protein
VISVVIPTIRPGSLELAKQSLKRQTYDDFEILVCAPFDPEWEDATWLPDRFEGGFWGLNRAYNALFRTAKGELIVTLQDFIWITPQALEKFWYAYQETGGCISGVGHQYARVDGTGKPYDLIWQDPRKTHKYGTFYECEPNDIEWNFAALPRPALWAVGGMDEELDFLGYGGDQLQTMERLAAAGYHCYLDQTNESFTLRHARDSFGGDHHWNANHVILTGAYDKRKQELLQSGKWPNVGYL